VSARCDKHYRSYSNRSRQSQYAEAVAQEDLTCDFIDSVVMGNYNEMGFVNLDVEKACSTAVVSATVTPNVTVSAMTMASSL